MYIGDLIAQKREHLPARTRRSLLRKISLRPGDPTPLRGSEKRHHADRIGPSFKGSQQRMYRNRKKTVVRKSLSFLSHTLSHSLALTLTVTLFLSAGFTNC